MRLIRPSLDVHRAERAAAVFCSATAPPDKAVVTTCTACAPCVLPTRDTATFYATSATVWTPADGRLGRRRRLRKSGGAAAVGRETALLALGGC